MVVLASKNAVELILVAMLLNDTVSCFVKMHLNSPVPQYM